MALLFLVASELGEFCQVIACSAYILCFQMSTQISFISSGFSGKVLTAKYCRENSIPFLGICLGFQAMVVEYSRTILHWEDANSTEFDEDTKNPVVLFMPEIDKDVMGGTMRLGSRNTAFTHPTHEDVR